MLGRIGTVATDTVLDPRLRASYAACARMQRRHDPTYYWATRWLPRDVRPAVHALYGFVRSADEIVDGPGRPPTPEARRAALDGLEQALRTGLERGESSHPAVAALVDAGSRHDLPLDELHTYMRSMRIDCGPVRIADHAELECYMDGSTGTVGRIMAPLLGAPARSDDFARLGMAFQLTNFIRDVEEDWRLDRLYLPELPEEDVAAGRATPQLRAGVAAETSRARGMFADTHDAARGLDPAIRRGVRVARAVYLGVLDRVEANGYDVLGSRAGLRPWEAGRAVLAGWRDGNGHGNGHGAVR
jgi:15-cis-phytoene synthase